MYFIHSPSGFSWKPSRQINILSIKTVTDFLFALAECRIIENRKCQPLTKSCVISVNVGGIFFLIFLLCIFGAPVCLYVLREWWLRKETCLSLPPSLSFVISLFFSRMLWMFIRLSLFLFKICPCFLPSFLLMIYAADVFKMFETAESIALLYVIHILSCVPIHQAAQAVRTKYISLLRHRVMASQPLRLSTRDRMICQHRAILRVSHFLFVLHKLVKVQQGLLFHIHFVNASLSLSLTFSFLLSLSLLCGLCTENRCGDLFNFLFAVAFLVYYNRQLQTLLLGFFFFKKSLR